MNDEFSHRAKTKGNRLIIEPYSRDRDDGIYVCMAQNGQHVTNASLTIDDKRKYQTIHNTKPKYNQIILNKQTNDEEQRLVELICEPSNFCLLIICLFSLLNLFI